MPTPHLIRLTVATLGFFGLALAAQPSPAAAQTTTPAYPWCTVGEEVHCYYMTREQCEETVDYHGFCEQNPDMPAQSKPAPNNKSRRAYPQ